MRPHSTAGLLVVGASIVLLGSARQGVSTQATDTLARGMTFHAGFDGTTDARFALGDRVLYSSASRKEAGAAVAVVPDAAAVQLARGEGRRGDALRLKVGASPFVFYKGERNIAWQPRDWSGTVSLWMQLDPDADLAPGYSDPLIITPRAWNDAALFVDFTRDDVPRRFRFAAFADRKVWDPATREWETVPIAERPMVEMTGRRFARGKWTHVAWTWNRFNTGLADGVLTCYLDGEAVGTLSGRVQTFTWDPKEVSIALAVQYIGLMDELAIFNRALTAAEVRRLRDLPAGAAVLTHGR
jgi:hypothetical protein